jgi:nicotinate-nucleotide pyrophosphorylase (carboxylating)
VGPNGWIDDDVRAVIARALAEDRVAEDVTSAALVPASATGRAVIRAKQEGVIAGIDVAQAVFAAVDSELLFEARVADGSPVLAGSVVAHVTGSLRSLLAAERTALNFLQRMSGVATLTAQFVEAVAGTRAVILATRKTTPGLRAFDLAAVRAGGGEVHRESLADRFLVKENHVAAARSGGLADDVEGVVRHLVGGDGDAAGQFVGGDGDAAGQFVGGDGDAAPGAPLGIEVTNLGEVRQGLRRGVDVLLLDNFTPTQCAEAVALRKQRFPGGGGPAFEASGNVTLRTVRAYADAGVERISAGALTHSAPALDLSMLVELDER